MVYNHSTTKNDESKGLRMGLVGGGGGGGGKRRKKCAVNFVPGFKFQLGQNLKVLLHSPQHSQDRYIACRTDVSG